MIAAALRNSARIMRTTRDPIRSRPSSLLLAVNPGRHLPNLNLTRGIVVSAPPARRIPLATKIGFFVFFFFWLMIPEMAMLMAIPNHAGTSTEAIRRRMEEEADAAEELAEKE